MAFDGIAVAALTAQLQENLIGGRIYKIAQPEKDEILLTVRKGDGTYRLFISAGASLPLIYLTEQNKPSPMTAPNFCMLLRKHLQNGRILSVTQPGLERIIRLEIEHLNEMGDLCKKYLIAEMMGKHSNLIFTDEDDRIIDSIKRVSLMVSSVREVLPGKQYFVPETMQKEDMLTVGREAFLQKIQSTPKPLFKALYLSFTGLSPIFAQELCYRAHLDGDLPTAAFSEADLEKLLEAILSVRQNILSGEFAPCILYDGDKPVEFSALPLSMYGGTSVKSVSYASMSVLLETYFAQKNAVIRIRQKGAELSHIVQTALERNVKKYDLQLKQMEDTKKRDTYRIYGELLNTYGYGVSPGAKYLEAENYYDGTLVKIPLDVNKSASENAKYYFEKYGKLKRTYEALSELTKKVAEKIEHLRSVEVALQIALKEEDLVEIREELAQSGYIRKKPGGKKTKITSKPFHYLSSDGYDIYVGKNNLQNDELTFRFASGGDWWFHAKQMPGSHVIVKAKGYEEVPDQTMEEAASLAAYYSAGREQAKVEVDYVRKKNVKKPNGAKPGFVVYYTNYSMTVAPDMQKLRSV